MRYGMVAALLLTACGTGPTQQPTLHSDAGAGGNGPSDSGGPMGASNGGFAIAVQSAEWRPTIGSTTPPNGHWFAVLVVRTENVSEAQPVLVSAAYFSVLTKASVRVAPLLSLQQGLTNPCTNFSVVQGAQVSCSIVVATPAGDPPFVLDYSETGRWASAPVRAITGSGL